MMLGDALKDLLKKKQSGQKIEAPREREPSKVVNLTRNYDSVPSLDVLAGAADFHFSVECLVIGTPGSPVLVELRR